MEKRKKSRRVAGHWRTREIAEYLGVSVAAVLMNVKRGKLVPTEREGRESHLFTDEEVQKFFQRRISGLDLEGGEK